MFCSNVQSSYQAPRLRLVTKVQARLRLAEMHPLFVNSGGRSLHTNAFPGRAWERVERVESRAWERVVSCATLMPISKH